MRIIRISCLLFLFLALPSVLVALAAAALGAPVKLQLWTFADTHADWWNEMAKRYQREVNPGFELAVSLVPYGELHDKIAIVSAAGSGAPDIADVEQGRFGGYFKAETLPFVDLTPFLQKSGHLKDLVQTRQALYMWKGKMYGLEHALTPVVLYYRRDLFDRFGLAPEIPTWDDFVAIGKKVSSENLKMSSPPNWEVLLRQRGSDLFGTKGEVTADSPLAISTLEWVLDQVESGIVANPPSGMDFWKAVSAGRYLTLVGADWYGGFIRRQLPDLSGEWGALPLPVWQDDPVQRQTSVAGGTGITLLASSKHIDEAWRFIQYAALTVEGNALRYQMIQLFPPFIPAFRDKRLIEPDPYFGGQRMGLLFGEIGLKAPAQYQSPFRPDFYTAWGSYAGQVFEGRLSARDGLREASERIRQMMAEWAAK